MRRSAVLLLCAALQLALAGVHAGPADPALGICESRCDPLTVPPDPQIEKHPVNVGQTIW